MVRSDDVCCCCCSRVRRTICAKSIGLGSLRARMKECEDSVREITGWRSERSEERRLDEGGRALFEDVGISTLRLDTR